MKIKKSRRIIALVLALTMIFTFMAMSASAATTEVQPRGTCPNCTNGYIVSETKGDVIDWDNPFYNHNCTNIGASHAHYYRHYTIKLSCRNCGYLTWTYPTVTYCPHA